MPSLSDMVKSVGGDMVKVDDNGVGVYDGQLDVKFDAEDWHDGCV